MNTQLTCGDLIETDEVLVFFGNSQSNLENLKAQFASSKTDGKDLQFLRVKQTHSDICVEASSLRDQQLGVYVEADAHFTSLPRHAVLISTADCLPVMIHLPTSKLVLGIHAGWRGVASNIIGKSLRYLKTRGHDLREALAWIGPHIGFQSFEVGLDVAAQLRKAYDEVASSSYGQVETAHTDPSKKRINLLLIATMQLVSEGIDEQNIQTLLIDTFKSSEHESHRRDGSRAGRQLSFIALK